MSKEEFRGTKYFSSSKDEVMDPSDMHMMHIENVLAKDLREDNLDWKEQAALLDEYIVKVRRNREKLHRIVKNELTLNKLLFEVLKATAVPVPKPVRPKRKVSDKYLLEFYREVALGYIKNHGRISADQLRKHLENAGYNVAGQLLPYVFRDPRFEQVGYRRSSHPGAKGRFINNWTAA